MTVEMHATSRLLKRAQYRNHRALERALGLVGTTLAQWDGLRVISEAPDSTAHALAIASFQSDQAFGTLANRLEAQQLIERAAGKGRRITHRLTATGKAMLEAGKKVAVEVSKRSFAALTKKEIATLHALLLRVGEEIE